MRNPHWRAIVVVAAVITACGDDGPGPAPTVAGVRVPEGYVVDLVTDGLDGPTQFAVVGDRIVVAELNGGERDGTGRVIGLDSTDPAPRVVLLDGLVVPTGVAVTDDGSLWVMEQRRLTVGPLDDPTDRSVVADELAFNGRSEGTVTALPSGGVLYDTSGRREGDDLAAGSGSLWFVAGVDAEPVRYATGFKHAYAHVVDADGVLWSTEMADGLLDGAVPPDELVAVERGDDFGYPRCSGDRRPVVEFGGSDAECDGTPRSQALFEPGATPTSVAVAPWDPDLLVVALWNRGRVVTVPRTPADRPFEPDAAEDLVTGIANPQHLLVVGDRLLISDHGGGRILAVSRP